MRENRTYGSEGGESGKPDFPTPIDVCSARFRPTRWMPAFAGMTTGTEVSW